MGVEDMVVEKIPASYSLVEVLDRVLNRGIVIERWEVLLALFYIDGLVLEERAAIISVDTYLKYAEAAGLLPLEEPRHVTEYVSREPPRAEFPE